MSREGDILNEDIQYIDTKEELEEGSFDQFSLLSQRARMIRLRDANERVK